MLSRAVGNRIWNSMMLLGERVAWVPDRPRKIEEDVRDDMRVTWVPVWLTGHGPGCRFKGGTLRRLWGMMASWTGTRSQKRTYK